MLFEKFKSDNIFIHAQHDCSELSLINTQSVNLSTYTAFSHGQTVAIKMFYSRKTLFDETEKKFPPEAHFE